MGHGHVIKNEDGSTARCGGPAMCSECAQEQAEENNKINGTNFSEVIFDEFVNPSAATVEHASGIVDRYYRRRLIKELKLAYVELEKYKKALELCREQRDNLAKYGDMADNNIRGLNKEIDEVLK